jgi:hypothetical protein
MKVINLGDGQSVGDDLADLPLHVVTFLTALGVLGEQPNQCDCPPGICLDEEPEDDFDFDDEDEEFAVEFEPDFELVEELTHDQKVGAVAQLGRIIEGVTIATEIHARLLQDLVD